ncbi:MAG: SEC-C domain-containing protein [Bryobacteraceae bacterium]|nr:SEC-C domain-containing protein [Bryobacteraceae bacterium]
MGTAGVPESVPLHPGQFAAAAPRELLEAAARGLVGIDRRLIRAILDRFDEFLPELVRFGTEDRRDPVPLDQLLLDLFRFRPAPEAIPFLIRCIRDGSYEYFEDELTEAFSRLGAAALEPLLQLCPELEPGQQAEVHFILASLGIRDPRIYSLLMQVLPAEPGEGAFLLSVYGDPAAVPELQRVLERRAELNPGTVVDLEEAIRELSEPAQPAELEHYDIFEDYAEQLGPLFGVLSLKDRLRLTHSPSAEYRAEAVESFDSTELEQAGVRERLVELAESDPDANVRGKAWARLGAVADEALRETMWRRLRDEQVPPQERAGALVGLSHGDCAELGPYILRFYETPDSRPQAMEAMWRALDPVYAPYFSRHLEDPDVNVRREAVTGAGVFRMSAECGRLEKLFHDEAVRPEALRAYALAAPGKVSAVHARQVLAKIEQLAGGLSDYEAEMVCRALDMLLDAHGRRPVFYPEQTDEISEDAWAPPASEKVGRNDPCPCGSGKKYKKCCGAR